MILVCSSQLTEFGSHELARGSQVTSERTVQAHCETTSVLIEPDHSLEVIEVSGGTGHPIAVLLAGVHGDEEEGVISARRVVAKLRSSAIEGTVRVVPVASAPAYRAGRRLNPVDGANLARVFPGDKGGTSTQKIAAAIVERVLRGASMLIDLHSAGSAYAMPLFCGYIDVGRAVSRRSKELAAAFGAPIVWRHRSASPGRSLSVALDLGVPAIYAECRGGGLVRGEDTDGFVNGTLNVLRSAGILPYEGWHRNVTPTCVRDMSGDIDAGQSCAISGTFVARTDVGQKVARGDCIGEVYRDDGNVATRLTAEVDGVVMLLSRRGRFDAGATLAIVAEFDDSPHAA